MHCSKRLVLDLKNGVYSWLRFLTEIFIVSYRRALLMVKVIVLSENVEREEREIETMVDC